MRIASLLALAALTFGLPSVAAAQSDAAGPVLQPSDTAPVMCDPNAAGFRYVEIRGSGFDAWSTQHLVGSLSDASGAVHQQWPNVWVSPQGRLTLEVNLCADPIQNRGALDVGDYTVAVGQSNGGTIATAGISLAPPAEAVAEPDVSEPAPTPTSQRTGPGTQQQPLPLGAPGSLVDGWQLTIQSVEPDAYQDIKSTVASAVRPNANNRDFLLRIQATYLGRGTGVLGGSRLALYNPTSQKTYDQLANNCGAISSPVPPTVVPQGSVIGGDLCFVVRAADVGSLVAYDNQPNPADRVYFALQ